MLNTFSYESGLCQLPKRDNLHIKDKRPAPNAICPLFGSSTVVWKVLLYGFFIPKFNIIKRTTLLNVDIYL